MTEKSIPSWKFPKEFWLANLMELCERAAYYGFFVMLTVFLTSIVGFSDIWGNTIAGLFMGGLYLLPPFVGAIVDRMGFRKGLIMAFGLLTTGYFFLGLLVSKAAVILFLGICMVGGSFIKPLITGTVAKTTDKTNRARGFSLFYWVVNIGAFGGKTFVPAIRQSVGLEYVAFFSAAMSFLALMFAIFFYKPTVKENLIKKSVKDVFISLLVILKNGRLMAITLIVSGFWLIQHQLYATMPKYIMRMAGNDTRPEWISNVNPLTVVLFVMLITNLMKRKKAVNSMLIGMLIMPLSALCMSLGPTFLEIFGSEVHILSWVSVHPFIAAMILGIMLQGLAECFISPRFLEYFSLQAPEGQEGAYLGFSHLHSFLASIFGFVMSGFLLNKYCPDPKTLPAGITEAQRAEIYANAHHMWYYYAAIGFTAAIALLVFKIVTDRSSKKAAG